MSSLSSPLKVTLGGGQVDKIEYEIVDTQALIHSHHLEVKPNCCSILNISEDIQFDISSFSAPLILSRILPYVSWNTTPQLSRNE